MFTSGVLAPDQEQPDRRVREHVKDGLKVVAASAATSTAVAVVAMVLMKLAS